MFNPFVRKPTEIDKNIQKVQEQIANATDATTAEVRKLQLEGLLATKAAIEPDRRPSPDTILRSTVAIALAAISVAVEQTGVFQGSFTRRIPDQAWQNIKRN